MGVSTTHRNNLSMWILIYSFSDTYYVWAACALSCFTQVHEFLDLVHVSKCLVKLITNRWAWALVPIKLVELGNALAWGGGIHGNPASGPHQAPSLWKIQWNTYRPILTWPITPEGGRDGKKPKHKKARKQQAIATTLYEELQASNCEYMSQGAPDRGIGHS